MSVPRERREIITAATVECLCGNFTFAVCHFTYSAFAFKNVCKHFVKDFRGHAAVYYSGLTLRYYFKIATNDRYNYSSP